MLGRTGVVVAPLSWLWEVVEGVFSPSVVVGVVSVLPGVVVSSLFPSVVLLVADVVLGSTTGCDGTNEMKD